MSDPGGDLRQLGSTLGGSSPGDTVAADELEPQLKYERLGADVKSILQDASATCLCLSEKVLALGTSAGNIHILDYSGNEVKRFSLHKQPVKHISFDDKAEYFASCCGDSYISISSLYADETTKFTFKRPITVVALEPRYASRKTREFVTGDVRGRLKLSSQGWLGRSDHVLHQGEGTIRAVSWHTSTLVWANEVGIKVYDTNTHQFVGSIKRPRGGRFADCFDCQLYLHEDDDAELLFVAWPDCIKVAEVLTHVDPISGAMSKTLHITASIPTDYFCMGAVPHGSDLAVLVYVTDADPDQDQVGLLEDQQPQPPAATAAAAHVQGGRQQQQQQQQQHKQQHEPGQLKMEPLPQQQQQQQQPPADAGQADSASGAQPSVPGPINIPQPVKRPQRAANAFVRSPSGPSFLEAAAAAAVAGAAATAAATAAAGPVSTGSPTATPRPAAEAVGEGASSSNSSPSPSKVMPSGGVGSWVQGSPSKPPAGAAAGAAGAAAASAVRPPAASYSRSGSAASRASSGDNIITHTYVPPGAPLRPELRILSLTHKDSSSSGTTRHTHTPSLTAAAGEESKQQQPQQQQQLCSGCIEKASDALSVKGYQHYLPSDYQLVPSYGNELALLSSGGSQRKRSGSAAPGRKGRVSARSSGGGSSTRKEAGATGAAGGATQPGAVQGRDASAPPSPAKAPPGSKQQQQQVPAAAVSKDGAAAAEAAAAQPAHTENAAAAAAAATGCDVISADTAAAGEAVTGQQGPSGADVDAAGVAAVAGSETAPSAAAAASSKDAVGAGAEEEVDELLAEDFGEFMYFIVSPQDIVIGRHRDVEDRISWCLSAGRFEAALSLAEADRNTRQEVWETVVQAYLESLTTSGRWSVAASMLPRLLKDQTALWERWVYTFAQARHLTLLAPVLPTRSPLLPSQDYDLVLQALLVDPVHHAQLLELVSTWPHAIFHPTKLIDAIAQRMQRPGGESRELWQALALLYKGQGRPDLSLAIYLQLQLPSVFDFIQENSLLLYLDQNAYLLMAIDEKRALELLTAHLDTLPPASVVPSLLDAMSLCESKGDEAERETWRHRLFNYLDRVFQLDPSAGGEYAELCVHLYADYCPSRLMDFLQGSQTYPLEAALEVAQQRGLIDEQVYVLSRMGNSRAALRLIIRNQQDIPRAIEFVRLQRDEELWEELIDWALSSADTTGQLLEHIGGNINPLRVIQKIPEGLAITRLRDRLRGIIADFRTQTSLREGCNAILRSDCLHLVQRLQREVKRALPTVWVQRLPSASSTAAAVAAAANAGADGIDTEAGTAAAIGAKAPVRAYPAAIGATGSSMDSSKGSAGFVPGVNAGKGPHWLKYQCGSGQPMEAASSQDVPAVAVRALAAAATAAAAGPGNRQLTGSGTAGAGIGTLATLLAGATSGLASGSSSIPTISSSQPPHVWIGRTSGTDDTLGITSSGHDDGIMTDQQQPADGKAAGAAAGAARYSSSDQGGGRAGGIVSSSSSSSSSHRTSRHHRQRSAGGVLNLPSLVAA